MADLTCDVAVIGAGTAGLAAERSARRSGASTLLIDPAFRGTTCARVGCMPSKALIAAGHAAHMARSAAPFGIRLPAPAIDGRAVMERVRRLRDDFVAGVTDTIAALPDGVAVHGRARFDAPTRLLLDDGRGVEARAVVIATGSNPAVPAPFEAVRDRVLTNATVFEQPDLPSSLAVIGAGPLGLELAQAFARLGVAVAVFDTGDGLGGLKGEQAVALRAILSDEMAIRLGVETQPSADARGVRLRWSGAEAGEAVFERVLVAAGRPPALDGLALDRAGLALDPHGTPRYDRATMQCGDSAVFIAGDADHDRPVLHEASSEGAIAGRNAAQFPHVTPAHRTVPFAIMFTDPQVTVIGDTTRDDAIVTHADYGDQGRARMEGLNRGFATLHADRDQGRVIGAVLVAPAAEHLGHLLAWSIEGGLTATEMLDRPFYHPTYEEGLKAALRDICKAAGTEPPQDRDEGNPPGG